MKLTSVVKSKLNKSLSVWPSKRTWKYIIWEKLKLQNYLNTIRHVMCWPPQRTWSSLYNISSILNISHVDETRPPLGAVLVSTAVQEVWVSTLPKYLTIITDTDILCQLWDIHVQFVKYRPNIIPCILQSPHLLLVLHATQSLDVLLLWSSDSRVCNFEIHVEIV